MAGSQDYYFRFFSEVYGKDNLTAITASIGEAARQAKAAKEASEQWGKALEIAARNAGVTVKDLTAQIQKNAAEQKKAAEDAAKYSQLQEKMRNDSIRLAEKESAVMKAAATESRNAAEAATKAARANLEMWLSAGSNAAGGAVGGAGSVANGTLLGRVGGRVAGAELGRLSGIPGGGFIGSQIAYSSGISGQSAVALGAGALGLYAGFEIASKIADTTKWAQEQRNLGREFGVSAGQMAVFSQASEVLGVNLQGSIKAVSNLGSELEKGGSKYREVTDALSGLGLKPETAFKPAADGIKDIVAALSKIPDDGERARKAVDLLGESGRALAAAVKEIPDLQDKLTISNDAVDRVARLRDVLAEIDVKGGLTEAIAFLFQGVLPDRSARAGTSKLALPAGIGGKPQDTTFGITIGSGQFGELQSPAAIKAGRAGAAAQYEATHGTPEDKYQGTISQIDIDKRKIEREFREDLTLDQGGYEKGMAGIASRKATALAIKKAEEEAIRKREEYNKVIAEPIRSYKEGNDRLLRLRKDFPEFPVPPSLYGFAVSYANQSATGALAKSEETYQTPAQTESEFIRQNRERFGADREAQQTRDQAAAGAVSGTFGDIRNTEAQRRADVAQSIALTSGQTRYGLTPAELSRLELGQGITAISQQYQPQIEALQGRAYVARTAAGKAGISPDQSAAFEKEARDAESEAEVKRTEALTKSIETINKFNDSVDKAAEAMRNEFAGGFQSILMGLQSGGIKGQAGTGVLTALRGFGEKIEGQLLHNVGAQIYGDPSKGTGASGTLQKIGGVLPPWLTQGTVLGQLDKKLDPSADAIVTNATKNTDRIVAAIRGGGVGGGSGSGEGGGYYIDESGTPVPYQGQGGGASGVANDITGAANAVSGITAAAKGSSPAAIVTALASSLGKIGKGLGQGVGMAGDIDAITDNYEGETRTQQVGAIIGTAGIAAGVAKGIETAAKGGVRNVAGGAAEGLGSLSLIPGPQQPFIAAAAGVASLVSAFSPDPKTQRANQISKSIFSNQYLAPPSENITESGGGGYADLDIYGGVRNSRFSPYPITADPYLDVPRRTVVPGGTLSTFGGSGGPLPGTGANRPQVPTPITISVQTMDAKSFNDNATRIVDAAHLALQSGYHPLISTIRSQLGQS